MAGLSLLRSRRLALEVRQRIQPWRRFAILLGAVIFGLAVCAGILLGRGVALGSIYEEFGSQVEGGKALVDKAISLGQGS